MTCAGYISVNEDTPRSYDDVLRPTDLAYATELSPLVHSQAR